MAKAKTKAAEAETESKSIINTKKYSYKRGQGSPTALFIEQHCVPTEGDSKNQLDFDAFFTLCEKNELPQEKIDNFRKQIAENAHGAPGRARMTLGNMLAAKARKDQALVDPKGKKQKVEQPQLPKREPSAKKAA